MSDFEEPKGPTPADQARLRELRRTYYDAVTTKDLNRRESPAWCRATNTVTDALRKAREIMGDPTFCFPVR